MAIQRTAAWISTIVVAIAVALALPVSQLRTISIVKTCCCPDPTDCHCPDHQGDPQSQPSMQPCHSSQHVTVSPQAPAFQAPVVAVAAIPAVTMRAPALSIPAPHPAPSPIRPDAPS